MAGTIHNISAFSRIMVVEGIPEPLVRTQKSFSLRYSYERGSGTGDSAFGRSAKTFKLRYNVLFTPSQDEFSLRYRSNVEPRLYESTFRLRYTYENLSQTLKSFNLPYTIDRGIMSPYQFKMPFLNSFGFTEAGAAIFLQDSVSDGAGKYAAIYRIAHQKIDLLGQDIFAGPITSPPIGIAAIIENGTRYSLATSYFGITDTNKNSILESHDKMVLMKLTQTEVLLYVRDVDHLAPFTVKLVRAPAIESLVYIPKADTPPVFQMRSMIQTRQLSGGYTNTGAGINLAVDLGDKIKGQVSFPSPIDTLYAISPDGTKIVITNPCGPSDSTGLSRTLTGYDPLNIPQYSYTGSVGLFEYNAETDSITLSQNQYQSIIPGSLDYKKISLGFQDKVYQRQFEHAISGVCNDGTVIGLFKYKEKQGSVVLVPGVYLPLTPRSQVFDSDGELVSESTASTFHIKRDTVSDGVTYVDKSAITSTSTDGTSIATDLSSVFGPGVFVHNESKNMTILTNTSMYSLGFPWISLGGTMVNGVRTVGMMHAEVKLIKANIIQNGTHGSKIDESSLVKLELGPYFHSIFFDILVPMHIGKKPVIGSGTITPTSDIFGFDYVEETGACIIGIRSRYYSAPEDTGTFVDILSIPMADLGVSTATMTIISSELIPPRIPISDGATVSISAEGPTSFAVLRTAINDGAPIEIAYSNSGLTRTGNVLTDRTNGSGPLVHEYGTVYPGSSDSFLNGLASGELAGYEDEKTFQYHSTLPQYTTYPAGVSAIQQELRAGDIKSSQYANVMIRAVNMYTQWTPSPFGGGPSAQ